MWKHPNTRVAYVAQHAFHHVEQVHVAAFRQIADQAAKPWYILQFAVMLSLCQPNKDDDAWNASPVAAQGSSCSSRHSSDYTRRLDCTCISGLRPLC